MSQCDRLSTTLRNGFMVLWSASKTDEILSSLILSLVSEMMNAYPVSTTLVSDSTTPAVSTMLIVTAQLS